jgi:hypothetical protein
VRAQEDPNPQPNGLDDRRSLGWSSWSAIDASDLSTNSPREEDSRSSRSRVVRVWPASSRTSNPSRSQHRSAPAVRARHHSDPDSPIGRNAIGTARCLRTPRPAWSAPGRSDQPGNRSEEDPGAVARPGQGSHSMAPGGATEVGMDQVHGRRAPVQPDAHERAHRPRRRLSVAQQLGVTGRGATDQGGQAFQEPFSSTIGKW